MDMPRDIETYIHRIGRTGRIVEGRAVSFFDANNPQDQKIVQQLVQMLEETGSAEVPTFLKEAAEAAESNQMGMNEKMSVIDDAAFDNMEFDI